MAWQLTQAGGRSFWAEGSHGLEEREVARFRGRLSEGEDVVRFVRGRSDGKRAVWVATHRRILLVGTTWFGRTHEEAYEAIRDVEAQEGAHGITVRMTTASRRHALVAVDPVLAEPFTAHLDERTGATTRFIQSLRQPSPAELRARAVAEAAAARAAALAQATAPAPGAAPRLADTAAFAVPGRMPPPVPPLSPPAAAADHTATSLVAALREAAELHRAGVITDEEFAALKARLLGQ